MLEIKYLGINVDVYYKLYKKIMPLEDFEITGDLGKGSFGSVVKCIRRSDG